MNIASKLKGKNILVTGGTGSIGSALVQELLRHKPRQIRIFSRDESKQYYLNEKLGNPRNLRFLVGDVRDQERLVAAFEKTDLVFHAAALKHVPSCEYNPSEAVQTNILGSQNVITAALKNKVPKVIAVSTDKAVNPINVMGTTKLMMEKLFINANYSWGKKGTSFSCVRFGNVTWARGSVLSLWKDQAKREKTLKITDRKMTRFLMSKQEAINLMLKATFLAQGGEIFIFKMPSISIESLSQIFIEKYFPTSKIEIKEIGNRSGEKMHEELFDPQNGNEYVLENSDMFVVIPRMHIHNLVQDVNDYPGFKKINKSKSYSSKKNINASKIREII